MTGQALGQAQAENRARRTACLPIMAAGEGRGVTTAAAAGR
jgi:hypothetical protein